MPANRLSTHRAKIRSSSSASQATQRNRISCHHSAHELAFRPTHQSSGASERRDRTDRQLYGMAEGGPSVEAGTGHQAARHRSEGEPAEGDPDGDYRQAAVGP